LALLVGLLFATGVMTLFAGQRRVVRVELHDGPDPGALASTVWSSFTPEGRGAA
jgi:hypothetical protein